MNFTNLSLSPITPTNYSDRLGSATLNMDGSCRDSSSSTVSDENDVHDQIDSLSADASPTMNAKGKIMRKLLGQPTTTTHESTSNLDSPQLRPSASQSTSYSAGTPITCLDRSADGLRVVIAGPKVFKILRIDGSTITEELDLRGIITSYATTHDISAAASDQLNIRAVTWSYGSLENLIVTASGNGRMTVYDLNRIGEGLEVGRIHEHVRQVHRLAINPFKNNWLLSASHDGTIKAFDISAPVQIPGRNGATFRSLKTFKCNADAVRDIKWSPTDGMEFACCTDAGLIQKWDYRKYTAPSLKISAHQSACFSISWHPDGEHLVSGGMDQLCHVWDLSKKAERNQRPRYTFSTPAPVARVSWRPACWSATAQGKRAAQVTVAYDGASAARGNMTKNVHIWDLARPTMPFKEIEEWDNAPTGLIWNSRDLLWSVDEEGNFLQTDVAFVAKLIDRRSLSTFSFSPTGDVLLLLEERQPPRRTRPSISSPDLSPTFQHNSSGPLLSVSRSDSEEDVVGSFLGARLRKGHRRRNSGRLSQSMSTTPPSSTGMTENKTMSLDEAVDVTGTYKPKQVMAIGHAPAAAKRSLYKYFSNHYLLLLASKPTGELPNIRLAAITEQYAKASENANQYRLAQTWRILGYLMGLLLTRRAEDHREFRLAVKKPESKEERKKDQISKASSQVLPDGQTPRKLNRPQTPVDSPRYRGPRSIIVEDIESTSNVATPLVRPVRDSIAHETREAMHTPIIDEDDDLKLPDAVHPPIPSPIPVPGARQSPGNSSSSVEGYDFYGLESFEPPLEYVAPTRKPPLRLDYQEPSYPPRIQPARHDSGESFQMFSTSGDSQHGQYMSSSGSDSHSATKEPDRSRSLRERVSSWEDNLNAHAQHRPSVDSTAVPGSETSDSNIGPHSHGKGKEEEYLDGKSHLASSPPVFRLQEASAPKILDRTPTKAPPREQSRSPSVSEMTSEDPNLLETDFLPWPNDPPFLIPAMDPEVVVPRNIEYECLRSALHAAAMVLLLRPLLPTFAIDEIQANAIIKQYHHRLTSFKLFTEAALLRNICVPDYPEVYATAQENVTIGFFCTDCQKPIENDPSIPGSEWKCPRCSKEIAPCAICLSREYPEDLEYEEGEVTLPSSLWWLCPGCGHGGHSTCMQAWHASGPEGEEGDLHSGGCCPLDGCLHPCLPGKWRDQVAAEKAAAAARELALAVKENTRQGSARGAIASGRGQALVRRDNREVGQSRAVEGARVALSGSSMSSTSPGSGVERKKSVKLVAPGEEAQEGVAGHGL